MWRIEAFETVPVELDFTSSEQGHRSVTAIESSGTRLVNAIELVEVESPVVQVEICESCGIPRCQGGGWVALRRIGESVVWVPAWSEMEKGDYEAEQYRPPEYVSRCGALMLDAASWDRMRALQTALPRAADLPELDSREAARVCQVSAPGRVLGKFPEPPRLRRSAVVAVSEGDLASEMDEVDECLQTFFAAPRQLEVVGAGAGAPIELWLDLPGAPAFRCVARHGNRPCVLPGAGVALVLADEAR